MARGVPPGTDPEYSNYRATIGASYEIDFWGKYRRATEAARANLLNSQFNRESVRLALIADVAKSYFSLRSLDAQVAITRRTISTRQASTALQRMRFEAGIASELDLRQGVISKLQTGRTAGVRLMDELARCVPDHLWLGSAEQSNGNQLSIEGVTLSNLVVSDFMSRLERSQMFSTVNLEVAERGSVNDRGIVKFRLNCQVTAGESAN